MTHIVKSRFSISSKRFDAVHLSSLFPWKIVEGTGPNEHVDYHITVFEISQNEHDRIDVHLLEVTDIIMIHRQHLESLERDCSFALWLRYRFPKSEGAGNIPPIVSSRLAYLRIELVLHLNEF